MQAVSHRTSLLASCRLTATGQAYLLAVRDTQHSKPLLAFLSMQRAEIAAVKQAPGTSAPAFAAQLAQAELAAQQYKDLHPDARKHALEKLQAVLKYR